MNDFIDDYFAKIVKVAQNIDAENLDGIIQGLVKLRDDGGRLFLLGAGGRSEPQQRGTDAKQGFLGNRHVCLSCKGVLVARVKSAGSA